MFEHPIGSAWKGNTEDRTGYACYIVGGYKSEDIWMRDWSQYHLIAELMMKAYKSGLKDGGELIKQAVDHALKSA